MLKLLFLVLCVNKFTHINIVDFFITRSITSNKFVLSSLNQEIRLLAILTSLKLLPLALCVNKFTHTRLLAIFNLVQLSYILTLVFLSVLFSKKVPKTWAVVYGIRCFLCSRVALRHLSVGSHLATRCLSQCLGRQELAALKHHATCFQALLGYSLCLPTLPFRPWRGITVAMKIH